MNLFKVLAFSLLVFASSFAADDLMSPATKDLSLPQTLRHTEQPASLQGLKQMLRKKIDSLEGENEALRKQLGLKSASSDRASQLSLLFSAQKLSLQEDSLETDVEFVSRVFTDFRKTMLALFSNLKKENIDLKEFLELQETKIPPEKGIREIGDDAYVMDVEHKGGAFSCVYEKVTPETMKFWDWYQKTQRRWASAGMQPDDTLPFYKGLLGAFTGLGAVLSHVGIADVWISYICTESITTTKKMIPSESLSTTIIKSPAGQAGIDNIEMQVGNVTSDDVPFITNMGVGRSMYRYFHKMLPQHKYIAPVLLGFSAFMQTWLNPTSYKPYMLTQMLGEMRKNTLRNFPKNSYVGDNLNFKQQEDSVQKYDSEYAKEIIEQYKNHPSVIKIDESSNFNLLQDGKVIWTVKNSDTWDSGAHWFFEIANTSTVGDPYIAIDRHAMIELFLNSVTVRSKSVNQMNKADKT